jgi:tetratricopeptide (TPR) repeat protein
VAWTSTIYMLEREVDAAEAALLRAVQIQRAPGLETVLVSSLNNLGCVQLERGRFDQARQVLDEALALSRRIPFPWGMAIALENLGELAYMQRDWLGAMAHWLQALPGVREQRHIYHEAMVLLYQGMALRRQGQPTAAVARVHESLRLTVPQQMHQLVADGLCACAALALDAGRPRRAAVLLHLAARQRKETVPTGPALLDLTETEAAVRAALSAADWHAARAEGDSLTAEQVLAQETATG